MSTAALVFAVTGSGVAVASAHLPHNSVGSAQIKNGKVKAQDLANGAVGGPQVAANAVSGDKVADGSLSGADISDNSLTGADIDESSLSLPAKAAVKMGPTAFGTMQSATVATMASVTFTAPANGFVMVTAASSFSAQVANTYVGASIYQDGTDIGDAWWDPGDADGFTDQRQTIDAVSAVTAGSHTWTLRGYDILPSGNSHASFTQARVIVEFFPAGG